MSTTIANGCSDTTLMQPTGGNAQCTGSYVETLGGCQFQAVNEPFPATCDTSYNCVLSYPGNITQSVVCNGQSQSLNDTAGGMSFSGNCTCVLSAGGAASASSSAPAVASSAQSAAATTSAVKSSGTKIGKSQGLLIIGFVFSMLLSMA